MPEPEKKDLTNGGWVCQNDSQICCRAWQQVRQQAIEMGYGDIMLLAKVHQHEVVKIEIIPALTTIRIV